MKKVLLVSNPQDSHTYYVYNALKRIRNVQTDLLFPELAGRHLSFSIDNSFTSCIFKQNNLENQINDYYSIWYRRPRPLLPKIIGLDKATIEGLDFARREWDSLLSAIYSICTKPNWVSHPDKIAIASRKLFQLSIAKKLGFLIPDTLPTNNPEEVMTFFEKYDQQIIAKPVSAGYFFEEDGRLQNIYSTLITDKRNLRENQIAISPVIFQEYIKKQYEIRVTIVGNDFFAVKIEVTGSDGNVDWRHVPSESIRYFPYELPGEQINLCRELLDKLGLKYAAIDLVRDSTGDYYFLEINPNGQYYWLERKLGLPITAALIKTLIGE